MEALNYIPILVSALAPYSYGMDHEDFVQNGRVKAIEASSSFNPKKTTGTLKGWMLLNAYYEITSHSLRRNTRGWKAPGGWVQFWDMAVLDALYQSHSDGEDYESEAIDRIVFDQRLDIVRVAMESLPEMERTVVERFYFKGESESKIGRAYGMTRDQIHRIKRRGITNLKIVVRRGMSLD